MHRVGVCDVQCADTVWAECEESLQKPNPGLSPKRVETIYWEIHKALVKFHRFVNTDHEDRMLEMFGHMKSEAVPDLKDIHVMYLAAITESDYLVTYNLSDFTREASEGHRFKVASLDDFLCDMLDAYPADFIAALARTIAAMTKKDDTVRKIIRRLGKPENADGEEEESGYDCPEISSRLLARIGTIEAAVLQERQN